jgi:tetratricopeptide (TPR) repeat protein
MVRWLLVGMIALGMVMPAWAQEAAPAEKPPAAAAKPEEKTPTADEFKAEGDALMAKKDYSKALSKYLMAWLQAPDNTVVLDRIADLFYTTGKYVDASHFYALTIRLDPRVEEPVVGLAQTYLQVKRADQALLLLDDPMRKAQFGKSVKYQQLLGRAFINTGKPEKAIPVLKAVIAQSPNQGALYGELGNACFLAKKYADADAAYAKALEKDPKDATAALYRSMALEKLEKWSDAVAALQAYLTLANPPQDDAQRKRLVDLQAKLPK